jgi:predicted porin
LNITLEAVQTCIGCGPQISGTSSSKPNLYRVSSNSSRLGVRGTESLGGGLNAIFQIESSISGDAGGGTLAGRETFVGLQGGWGTFKIGNFLAPYDDIHPIFGNVPTLTTSILSTAAIWGQGPSSKAQGGFDARLGNSVRYDSPNIAGFTGSIQASTNENSIHGMVYSMGGFYNAGPIQAGLAYERNEKARGAGLKDDAISLAGGFNFGIARVAGIYERLKYDAGGGDLKRDFYGVSGTFNLGPGQLYAFWGHANDGKGSAADGTVVSGLVKGSDTGADQYEISYTYPLSKRTLTYIGYVRIDNDTNARYTFNINPINQSATTGGLASEGKPQGLAAGIVHFF